MINPVYSPASDRYTNGIRYRRCGRSGIQIPEIALGLWHNFGDVNPLTNSFEMAHYAFDHGIVHFDLANNYGPSYGSAEETFGQIMKKSFAPYRDELFISSKAGYDMWPGPYGEWGSRKYLISSLNQSLKRMNLEYVDLFYSHRFDPNTPLEETMQALVDIVRMGKALYVGISNYPAKAAAFAYKYLRDRDVPCLLHQCRYNILNRTVEENGLLETTERLGKGLITFSPLAQGLLTDRYFSGIPADSRVRTDGRFLHEDEILPEKVEKLQSLNEIAANRHQTLAEMALAWLLHHGAVTSVLVGASKPAQILANVKAAENTAFTDDELEAIDRLSLHTI